ncbi:Uncharacterised protein [Serratia fonticola]|uniref:Uncharacterized protein n=1 Tax=Serratia fonticola TaxID=47917 RepID=A0A4U9W0Z3_SERFO|nr:Uncharacterised protein [Serratia fonticola]
MLARSSHTQQAIEKTEFEELIASLTKTLPTSGGAGYRCR